MILEGFKLMLAGMFVVYIFLSALFVMIKVSAYFFGKRGEPAPSGGGKAGGGAPSGAVAAVVSAAVTAYKAAKR
ncbi:MAG: hypothetical protein ACR2NQ_01830 [Thermodesulfobacteriota bacterium]